MNKLNILAMFTFKEEEIVPRMLLFPGKCAAHDIDLEVALLTLMG